MTFIHLYLMVRQSCSHKRSFLFAWSHVHSIAFERCTSRHCKWVEPTERPCKPSSLMKTCVIRRCLYGIDKTAQVLLRWKESFIYEYEWQNRWPWTPPHLKNRKAIWPNTCKVKFTSAHWGNFVFLCICFLTVYVVQTCQKS